MVVAYPLQPRALFPASAMAFEQSRSCALLSGAAESDNIHLVKNIHKQSII